MEKLINKLSLSVLMLACSACATTKNNSDSDIGIQFDNSLEQCISIEDYQPISIQNTHLLNIDYISIKPIGDCGCKSAIAQYRVVSADREISSGLISFTGKNNLTITLSNAQNLISEQKATVSFSCAQPQ